MTGLLGMFFLLLQKYGNQQPRRVPEQPPANSIGFMANLGFHEQERDKLNKEKRDEYNKFLDEVNMCIL